MLFHLPIDSNETSRDKFGGQSWTIEKFGIDSDWTAGKNDTNGGATWTKCKSYTFKFDLEFHCG